MFTAQLVFLNAPTLHRLAVALCDSVVNISLVCVCVCVCVCRVQRTYRKDTTVRKGGANKDEDPENEAGSNKRGHSPTEGDDSASSKAGRRKSSVAKVVGRIIFNPNRKDVHSVEGGGATANATKEPEAPPPASKAANQFRFYRGHWQDQRVLQLSADSLLSIVAEVCLYYSRKGMVSSVSDTRKISGQYHSRKFSALFPPPPPSVSFNKVSLDPPSITVSCREGRGGGRGEGGGREGEEGREGD
jgi:hypothetical protein